MPKLRNVDDQLPVFVSPASLTFYADDQSTHKRVLSVYNPYQVNLKFQVLSTDTKKYSVSESEGIIKSNHKVEIVLRHKAVTANNIGVIDKIRVLLFSSRQPHSLGQKDITITLLATKPDASSSSSRALDTEKFEPLTSESVPPTLRHFSLKSDHSERSNLMQITIIISTIVAFIAVMLPSEGQRSENIPSYLHLSHGLKQIAAYVLGLLTMAILQT